MYLALDGEVGAGDLSRMSTAPVAVDNVSGIQLPGDDAPPVPADVSRVTVGVDVSAVADISLPPMPDVPMTAPIDDLSFHAAGTSIMDPTSVATLAADEFGDETAFNETLQSAAADITLFAVSLLLVISRFLLHCIWYLCVANACYN